LAGKIKLLIVSQHLEGGGAEKILYRLILNLYNEFDITLVTLYNKGRYLKEILALPGINYICLNAERGNTFVFAFRLRKIIKVTRPDKIFSFLYYQNILTYLALIGLKVPVILSERSNHRFYLKRSIKHAIWRYLLQRAYNYAESVITVSDESKAAIIYDFRIPGEKIFTIYNGLSFPLLDKLKEEPVTDFEFRKDVDYVIAIGSLTKAKNYPLLIRSFSILSSKYKYIRLIILGKGEMENELNEIVAHMNLNGMIHFIGYRNNPCKYLKKASCYVLSSSWEGFPNSLLEAMYINGHVISTNCPTGPSEIISNNVNGLLCALNNPEELAAAIEKMCFDKDFRNNVFENSRKTITRFDEKVMVQEYRKILLQ
jgi:GalNAc-alpha-(1->4)-GalNAc-alpha-(1->3)-diNAcBac-PP-undecaprenol alpha-1,4-N-acetyl-D-galactosaminyltransferase